MEGLTKHIMLKALAALDKDLRQKVEIVIGGGGAMVMAHNFPLVTHDIDAIPLNMKVIDFDIHVKKVAKQLGLSGDWLNPYFSSFTYTLPKEYKDKTIIVFNAENLLARALGKDEMLIMKCFAHRAKDIPHAKALITSGANIEFVESHIESLIEQGIPEAPKAIDFLEDVMDQI